MSSTLFKIVVWILSIITLFGNCFIIIIIILRKRLRLSRLSWFIISLAVADFLVGLSFYPPLFFCERCCSCHPRLIKSLRWIFLYSSVCNLCAMTVDRYLRVALRRLFITEPKLKKTAKYLKSFWLVKANIARFSFGFRLNHDFKVRIRT